MIKYLKRVLVVAIVSLFFVIPFSGNTSFLSDLFNNTNVGGGPGTINTLPVRNFLGLTDTPNSYSGQGLKAVRVNSGETALEFYTLSTSTTLADVSANSTTTALSLYQMTSTVPVEFRASDTSTLLLLNETNKQVLFGSGTVSLPGFAFAADTDSGFFHNGANNWAWSGGGTTRFTFSTLGITSTGSGFALARNHSEALPTYAMAGDTDTGMGTSAANTLAWSTGGTYRAYLDSTGFSIGATPSLGKFESRATSGAQAVFSYDASNYLPITVSSAGIPTFQPTGNQIVFKATTPSYIINVHQSDSTVSAYRLGTYADSAESEYIYNGSAEAKISGRADSYIGLTAANDFGVGTSSPSAKLHVLKTTEQYRQGYDTGNYMAITTGSTGSTTFALTGTTPTFTFSQKIINGAPQNLKGYGVASLPTGVVGDIAYVNDATVVPAKGVAPVAGGTAAGVVFYDGAAWVGI